MGAQQSPLLNIVNCPCCGNELYRSVMNANGIPELAAGSPRLEIDDAGNYFMRCPHQACACRVAFDSLNTVPGNPALWRLSDIQNCQP